LIRKSCLGIRDNLPAIGTLISFHHPIFGAYLENFHLYLLYLFSESIGEVASTESATDDQIVKIRKRLIRLDLSGEDKNLDSSHGRTYPA
jgi:hypothetical protein